jgi:hypothetical protein
LVDILVVLVMFVRRVKKQREWVVSDAKKKRNHLGWGGAGGSNNTCAPKRGPRGIDFFFSLTGGLAPP